MNLNSIAINIRVRQPWQAIDLGMVCAKTWWWPLYFSWLIPVVVCTAVLNLALFQHPNLCLFIIWWLKPFWERLPLHYASRALFGEQISLSQLLKQIPRLYKINCVPWLLWQRFSFRRSFILPVTLLEGLKGSGRSKRITILGATTSSAPSWLSIFFLHLEQLMPFALLALVYLLIPQWLSLDFGAFFEYYSNHLWLQWLGNWLFIFSMSLIAPLYVCGGFMAYINRRVELEGWDIEIKFKALADRQRSLANSTKQLSLAIVLCLAGFSLISTPQPALAEEPQPHREEPQPIGEELRPSKEESQDAKQQSDANTQEQSASYRTSQQNQDREDILKIIESPAFFNTKTVKKLSLKERQESESDEAPEWLVRFLHWLMNSDENETQKIPDLTWVSTVFLILKWLLVALGFALIGYVAYRLLNRYGMQFSSKSNIDLSEAKPETLFGLQVNPESLPDRLQERIAEFLKSGQYREALGLMYRANLSYFIHELNLAIRSTHTEIECENIVAANISEESQKQTFKQLTAAWLQEAYAHRHSQEHALQSLFQCWCRDFHPIIDETGGEA